MLTIPEIILLSLASYRLTHLLVIDVIFNRFRSLFVIRIQGTYQGQPMMFYELQGGPLRRFVGKALNCFWCCGVWASGGLVVAYFLAPGLMYWVCLWLAVAAVQSLIETTWAKAAGWPLDMPPVEMMDEPPISEKFRKWLEKKNGGGSDEMPTS